MTEGKFAQNLRTGENRDVFRFLILETKHIIVSRNAIWLNKTYRDWKNLSPSKIDYVMDDDDDQEVIEQGREEEENGGMGEIIDVEVDVEE
jgi:hypothetical protein